MSMPLWVVSVLKKIFPARFYFAGLTRLPVIRQVVDYTLFRGDKIVYLPKDELAGSIDLVNEYENLVLPSEIVKFFIMKARYLWIPFRMIR